MKKYILLLFFYTSCMGPSNYNQIEKQIVVIPKGYIGRVAIIYDQYSGEKVKYTHDHRRLLEIPNCGILKTQFKAPYGIIPLNEEKNYFKFAYVVIGELNNTSDTIPFLADYKKMDTSQFDKICVFNRGLGEFGIKDISYDHVEEFFVDSAKNISNYESFNFTEGDLDKCD